MTKYDHLKTASNEDLLSASRGYRRGVNYYGGEAYKKANDKEIKRRQRLGLIKKSAKGPYEAKRKGSFDIFGDLLNF